MIGSAQVLYSIFNITSVDNNNALRVSFPSGSGAATFTDYCITIPDGFLYDCRFNFLFTAIRNFKWIIFN
jgi:hypothetical protein